jgi:DNA repair protein RadC
VVPGRLRAPRVLRRCHAARLRASRRHLNLSTGIRGETVTDLSQRLLADHGGLRGLSRIDVAERARIRGLVAARSVPFKSVLNLG